MEEYQSEEEFTEVFLDALTEGGSVFVYRPKYEEYGMAAYFEAGKEASYQNFRNQISLNPLDWINPDTYRVTKQETDDGLMINYNEV